MVMNSNRINAFFTAASTVCSMQAENELQQILQDSVKELFQDATFAKFLKDGIDNNLYAVDRDGHPFPTRKGFSNIFFPKTKIVGGNLKRVPHEILLRKTQKILNEICYRIGNFPAFEDVLTTKNVQELNTSLDCLDESMRPFNNDETAKMQKELHTIVVKDSLKDTEIKTDTV